MFYVLREPAGAPMVQHTRYLYRNTRTLRRRMMQRGVASQLFLSSIKASLVPILVPRTQTAAAARALTQTRTTPSVLNVAKRHLSSGDLQQRGTTMSSNKYKPAVDGTGAFVRPDSKHRHRVGTPEFPVEAGRYLVYIALACPWASRITAGIDLMGLQDSIQVVSVDAEFQRTKPGDDKDGHMGWVFAKEKSGKYIGPDPVFGARTLRDIYEACGDNVGKFTTPLLVDKISRKIVNNESSEILRMLNHEFSSLARHPFDLYPVSLRANIDEVNEWVYHGINNGVYRAGFAQSQAAYDEAVTKLFEHLDKAEAILGKMRYICSDRRITEADIRLFETLVRFDHVYHTHFKCNVKRICDYPNLLNYTREIYQLVPDTVDIDEIKKHYYTSHAGINPFKIIAKGPAFDYHLPHDRDETFPIDGSAANLSKV